MLTLGIKPVMYNGRRLHEVGETAVSVFSNFFGNFTLYSDASESDIRSASPGVFARSTAEMLRNNSTPFCDSNGEIIASDSGFNEFLTRFGQYTLGVTSAYTYDNSHKIAPGSATPSALTAHVLGRPDFLGSKIDTDEYARRMTNVAVHEIGHLFGLDHHDFPVETARGKLCSMVPRGAATDYSSYAEFYDGRKLGFCRGCAHTLEKTDLRLRTAA